MIEPQPPSPSNETASEQDAWSPQAAVAAKDFKYGAGSPVSVEILNDNGRRRTWSAVAVILLLSATSLAQAILASAVRRRVSPKKHNDISRFALYLDWCINQALPRTARRILFTWASLVWSSGSKSAIPLEVSRNGEG